LLEGFPAGLVASFDVALISGPGLDRPDGGDGGTAGLPTRTLAEWLDRPDEEPTPAGDAARRAYLAASSLSTDPAADGAAGGLPSAPPPRPTGAAGLPALEPPRRK